jgi:SsrA-binding protein
MTPQIILKNKKANFNFFVEEEFVAGMVLEGWMVKPILNKTCNLDSVYIKNLNGELFAVGFHVFNPKDNLHNNNFNIKLLLSRREIDKIIGAISQDGFTSIPLQLEYHGSRGIKLRIALAKGKKNYDKREDKKIKDLNKLG